MNHITVGFIAVTVVVIVTVAYLLCKLNEI